MVFICKHFGDGSDEGEGGQSQGSGNAQQVLFICVVMDVNETYYGDHFAIYTYIESLCGAPETNIMIYVNCT